ncbi:MULTISPECIES: CDP-glycerol glycerophosphotransferase family protein [Enterobacteriaceae]|uniref:CDP-glycerol glycerophosphotransferase family protein n=1 Tax=Enterobacteriaceae TaxID=543 RepID=UPI00131A2180|nr:CDP-glycerol glycerophosphotransferase family protein [Escherichia coli]QSF74412.1 CDP-glycerol glycerophosphotransferase family protein [Escherichia coli]HCW2765239.1 CDP-glycerol glycerophosphotransferase family protein [Escherichia coli]
MINRRFIYYPIAFILSLVLLFFPKNKKNIIIYSYKGVKFNFNSRVFFDYLRLRKQLEHNYYFIINDDKLRYELQQKYGNHFITTYELGGLFKILMAKFWVTSTRPVFLFPQVILGRTIINLWHGMPIKKISVEDASSSYFMRLLYKYYYPHFYSKVISYSEVCAELMKRSFCVDDSKILISGSPVGQIIGHPDLNNSKIEEIKVIDGYKVLYAPTYRDGSSTRYFPFHEFDIDKFNSFLNENKIHFYVRPHHLDNYNIKKLSNIHLLTASDVEEITYHLSAFDVLITDYSSLLVDFLLTSGRVIFIPYDLEFYLSSRGQNFNYYDITPGPIAFNEDEFKNALIESCNNEQYYQLERKKVREVFHSVDSNQCDKIYNYILSFTMK